MPTKPGHKRSPESIAKQKKTIQQMAAKGEWTSQLPEARKKNSGPHPQRAVHGRNNPKHLPVGSVVLASNGYLRVKIADPNIWMYQHRQIVEQQLGRQLETSEEVHHINNDKTDNRPENLVVMSKVSHSTLPSEARAYPRCTVCGYRHPPHPSQ